VALQLGGNSAQDLAVCSQMAEEYGYDEVNLNVGCPSPFNKAPVVTISVYKTTLQVNRR
jgi:tRNA-dihydrouridine synthase